MTTEYNTSSCTREGHRTAYCERCEKDVITYRVATLTALVSLYPDGTYVISEMFADIDKVSDTHRCDECDSPVTADVLLLNSLTEETAEPCSGGCRVLVVKGVGTCERCKGDGDSNGR